MVELIKSEYPRPEFLRKNWTNLNGFWALDYNVTEKENSPITKKINVPFSPESKTSGLQIDDVIIKNCIYKRAFTAKKNPNERILLHFESVNYYAYVYINGCFVGKHKGGYTPFSFDITEQCNDGENELKVYTEFDVTDKTVPSGKQSDRLENYFVLYNRSSGIWQTVWLEYVPTTYIKSAAIETKMNGDVKFDFAFSAAPKSVEIEIKYKNKCVAKQSVAADTDRASVVLNVKNPKLWSADKPRLYDVVYTLTSESGCDKVNAYFGFRSIELKDGGFYLNGKREFQNLVLDQGYYPDGIYTAKNDDETKRDILRAKKAGFNGARLHQKDFERRFLYFADLLGFYVWGEYASWGFNHTLSNAIDYYYPEWSEAVLRDFNHPSILVWCPLNENCEMDGKRKNDDFVRELYQRTKKLDATRPCIDVSWNYHVETDIYDVHDYTQDVAEFQEKFGDFSGGIFDKYDQNYAGQPYMLSEYGGISFQSVDDSFSYGDSAVSEKEFVSRFTALIGILKKNKRICGVCYTQLYDVCQEQNGIFKYDRTSKLSEKGLNAIRRANRKK
ncbi:MAG: beta-galactosidase [Clostridia bacterium]|nr:beta-galactosidase [Clostridia bacterium]